MFKRRGKTLINIIEYLEKNVELYPEKPAYTQNDKEITYKQLYSICRGMGTTISKRIKNVNQPVVVLAQHEIGSIIAFFSIVYSGNYYVPLDSKMPKKRLKTILKQIETPLLLYNKCDEKLALELSDICSVECIENIDITHADEKLLEQNRLKVLDIDPLYMIFTSGSTGIPKGIVISHRSVIDFTEWFFLECGFGCDDIMGNQAPFYFDLSVKDIYVTLKSGGTCHILDKKLFMFPKMLVKELNEKGITSLVWATSAFHLVANSGVFEKEKLKTVKKVILGGEALRAKQLNIWKKAMPSIKYTNLYGPTEVTVDCTYYHIDKDYTDDEVIPIGKACKNKEVFLLDDEFKPVKTGETGQICVRGTGLAHGYFADDEKTSLSFIQDPRNKKYRQIVYLTGDLAYENEQGLFVFVSRKDGQIKHMGYRIELGELEHCLNSFSQIDVAIVFFDEDEDKIVCFYEGKMQTENINKTLKEYLPKYMLPNIIFKLDEMPYNSNGKIDRAKLKGDYLIDKNNRYNTIK